MKRRTQAYAYESVANVAVSDLQKLWIDKMNNVGYEATACFGAGVAIMKIKTYLGIPL